MFDPSIVHQSKEAIYCPYRSCLKVPGSAPCVERPRKWLLCLRVAQDSFQPVCLQALIAPLLAPFPIKECHHGASCPSPSASWCRSALDLGHGLGVPQVSVRMSAFPFFSSLAQSTSPSATSRYFKLQRPWKSFGFSSPMPLNW